MHPHWPVVKTFLFVLLAASLTSAVQQEQKQEPKPEEKPAAPPLSASARLAAARTALLRKTGNGDNAAYDVVSTTLEGWGRFTLVNSLEKADIVVEIFSQSDSDGGISASVGSDGRRGREGKVKQSSLSEIRLTVSDARSRVPLWTGIERPKSGMKKTDRENKEVEAAERLMQRFHDAIEPPGK